MYCSEGLSLGEVRCARAENQGEYVTVLLLNIVHDTPFRHSLVLYVLSRQLDIIKDE